MKTCTKCNTEQPLENFDKHSASPDGRRQHCKECRKIENLKTHATHNPKTNWVSKMVYAELRSLGFTDPYALIDGLAAKRKALRAKFNAMWDEGVHHAEVKQQAPEKLVPDVTTAQKKVLAHRRSQQQALRAQVLVMENGCRATGLQDPASLEVAHMKPYAQTNEFSAVDYDNCILLTPNMHNLFDRGLISFTDAGELMKSYALTFEQAVAMGVPALIEKPQRFRPGQIPYLRHHQREVFIREKEVAYGT